MFARDSKFFTLSKEIVQNFLQSVVIIDDRAHFELPSEPHGQLRTPRGRFPSGSAEASEPPTIPNETSEDDSEDVAHILDAKHVIDSFASKGMLCSVMRPSAEERSTLSDRLHNLAVSADIIIIDWSLHRDSGAKTLEMIQRLLDWTMTDSAQLRLVVVYSGDRNFLNIPSRISESLQAFSPSQEDNDFTITCGPIRIVVLAKPDTPIVEEQIKQERTVAFEEIADRVIEEFTEMTIGLIPNTVLKSLTQLRQNTHKILNKFTSELDAPFLTHRSLLPIPADAEDHLTTLISQELLAVLEEGCVGNAVNIKAIGAWVESAQKDFSLQLGRGPRHISKEELFDLLEKGKDKWSLSGLSRRDREDAHKRDFSSMFCIQSSKSQNLDEKFAIITIFRSYYQQPFYPLTLGTIIKDDISAKASYWLCTQPLCDCVRLESPRAFPFLPLQPINKTGDKFEILLENNEDYLKFIVRKRPYDLKMIWFAPDTTEPTMILSTMINGYYYFQSIDGRNYQWVGELRADQAQKYAHKSASAQSRIGVNESEWLRLWSPRG